MNSFTVQEKYLSSLRYIFVRNAFMFTDEDKFETG